jgi:hypothetical protein
VDLDRTEVGIERPLECAKECDDRRVIKGADRVKIAPVTCFLGSTP